jgi:MFS family permease
VNSKGFSGRFWALIGATFLGFLGIGTVLPMMGPHVRHDLGASDQQVGFVIGVFSFVALAARLVVGPMADRRGRRFTLITGLACCAAAGVIYLVGFGLAGAYLGRILQGFGEACLYTGAAVWAVEMGGVGRSAQTLGYVSSGIWGGISCGPVVGQWLGSFPRAAAMQTIAALVAIAVLARITEDYRPLRPEDRQPFRRGHILLPGLAVLLVNVQYPVVTGFLVLHLANHGGGGPRAFTAFALLVLVSRFFLGGLPDRIHPAITYYFGISLMCVGLLAIAAGPSPVWSTISAAVLGFGFSFPWSAIGSTVLRRTPQNEHGSAVSFLSAFYDISVGSSAFAAGAIATRSGYPGAFIMAAVALVGAAIVGHWVFKGTGHEPSPPGPSPEEGDYLPA